MATTNFTDDSGQNDGTLIVAAWLNDADALVYQVFNTLATAGADGTILVSNGTTYVEESGATARTSLGLAIGTDVQAYDAGLADIAALAVTDGNVIVGDGTNWVAESGATARTSLGLTIGTNVQAYDAGLLSIAGLTTAADKMIYTTASDTYATTDLTSVARSILDDTTAAAILTTLAARGQGKETVWLPATAFTARSTNGAASGTVELATNDVMLSTFDFDTTTEEGVQFMITMPKSWNSGTVTFQAIWTAASGSGGVAWELEGVSFANDDAMDTAFGTAVTVTDTLTTANDMHLTSESSAMTIAGSPGDDELVCLQVTRAVGNGSDTLGVDAKLLGIKLYFTTNAVDDT